MKRLLLDALFFVFVLAVIAVGVFVPAGCATVAPGQDPILVHAQQTLAGATPLYDGAMKWYFANAATLSPSATAIFEKVRTGYAAAYKALDDAVDAYKAKTLQAPDLTTVETALTQLVLDGTTAATALNPSPTPTPTPKPVSLFLPHTHPPLRLSAAWSF
jgi:hypothetical protein